MGTRWRQGARWGEHGDKSQDRNKMGKDGDKLRTWWGKDGDKGLDEDKMRTWWGQDGDIRQDVDIRQDGDQIIWLEQETTCGQGTRWGQYRDKMGSRWGQDGDKMVTRLYKMRTGSRDKIGTKNKT